ncbi:MAG: alpha-galactosidase, partial [Bacteroidota bacterium]
MKNFAIGASAALIALVVQTSNLLTYAHAASDQEKAASVLNLENGRVKCSVTVESGKLISDRLEVQPEWARQTGGSTAAIETDADFALDVMFTDWDAPGKANNADNLILLTKTHFSYQGHEQRELPDGAKELSLMFRGVGHSIRALLTYRLEPNAFSIVRNIAVMDSSGRNHLLRWFWPRYGRIGGVRSVVKNGGFGQPAAVLMKNGGAFFGLEYPASENHLEYLGKGRYQLRCGQEFGERIGKSWLSSDWLVTAVTPNQNVKLWFFQYVDEIRVAPLRPYSLYNTWYDLRSPEYPNWSADNVMSEKTAMKMVDLLRRNMIEKHNIKLDAFVLDDGWDVYKSDWVLRIEEWPNGLKPLADELKKTNTSLGVWFGPTGGYSFRSQRIGWMKDHGYEVVASMLCVAGKNYSALLKRRVTNFVQNDGVGYYKWDGIQFSCSEPDHGHPMDVYSRRAVLQTVAEMCRTVREKNPNIFLNITSGTWMSPWWVKHANTIWMQGADYGFADVLSISMRDGAITYRDFVLYEDWKIKGLWFPIANLMTHGIIKGKHESVGTASEPLDKFTDDVLLYFARGVSMYELYISPDILSEGEWSSISRSMAWARDRFPILMNTELVGGNPMKGEPYGYTHFKGKKGIIAARNPVIDA